MDRVEVKFGLTEREYNFIHDVLKRFPEVASFKIFGSRARGTHKYNSDIDIALLGEFDERIARQVYCLLDDLPLPYKFDIVEYNKISHPSFKEHIDKYGVAVEL